MKEFNRRRLIISGVLLILVIVLIVFLKLDIFTYSIYEKQVTSNNDLNTAVYLLDDSYQTITVRIPDVIPSNNQYLYTFAVSNFKDDKHCDTNLEYVVHIRTTTNLRIDYELYNTLDIDDAELLKSCKATITNIDLTTVSDVTMYGESFTISTHLSASDIPMESDAVIYTHWKGGTVTYYSYITDDLSMSLYDNPTNTMEVWISFKDGSSVKARMGR